MKQYHIFYVILIHVILMIILYYMDVNHIGGLLTKFLVGAVLFHMSFRIAKYINKY